MTLKVVYKASELSAVDADHYEFCASDESVDRMGDIIRVAGWELANYKRNPIVLFQHQSSNPVGISTKVWLDGKKLMARVKLAAEGTSPFIDTLRKLLAQKIVRAVSVGFMPTKEPNYIRDEQNDRITGLEFIGQELTEISLVSVPANANALNMAKSLNIPEAHVQRVFKEDASVKLALVGKQLEVIRAGARRF
jgi:HK97 family phage prohead protease